MTVFPFSFLAQLVKRSSGSQTEADRHNAFLEKGWAILRDYIFLPGQEPVRIGFLAKRRLRKAMALFHEALKIAPDNYAAKWALGKVHQVLGEHRRSLGWFEEAWSLEKGNADVCREAGLAAMFCGEFLKSLAFTDRAIALKPDDAGLYGNRALALMFLNRDADAIEALVYSLRLNPADRIVLNVRMIVHSVMEGRRPRPRTMKDL